MLTPGVLALPLGLWAVLRVSAQLSGGSDLDYRSYEKRAAYSRSESYSFE
ncbi:hypothetical protein [Nocardia sp. NBC_00511]